MWHHGTARLGDRGFRLSMCLSVGCMEKFEDVRSLSRTLYQVCACEAALAQHACLGVLMDSASKWASYLSDLFGRTTTQREERFSEKNI